MNHDVSTFKATSHATMSLKKNKQIGAFAQMWIPNDIVY